MTRPRARRAFSLAEIAVAFGLSLLVTGFVVQAYRFLSVRAGESTTETLRLREVTHASERLRRVLTFAARLVRHDSGFDVVHRVMSGGQLRYLVTRVRWDTAGRLAIVGPDGQRREFQVADAEFGFAADGNGIVFSENPPGRIKLRIGDLSLDVLSLAGGGVELMSDQDADTLAKALTLVLRQAEGTAGSVGIDGGGFEAAPSSRLTELEPTGDEAEYSGLVTGDIELEAEVAGAELSTSAPLLPPPGEDTAGKKAGRQRLLEHLISQGIPPDLAALLAELYARWEDAVAAGDRLAAAEAFETAGALLPDGFCADRACVAARLAEGSPLAAMLAARAREGAGWDVPWSAAAQEEAARLRAALEAGRLPNLAVGAESEGFLGLDDGEGEGLGALDVGGEGIDDVDLQDALAGEDPVADGGVDADSSTTDTDGDADGDPVDPGAGDEGDGGDAGDEDAGSTDLDALAGELAAASEAALAAQRAADLAALDAAQAAAEATSEQARLDALEQQASATEDQAAAAQAAAEALAQEAAANEAAAAQARADAAALADQITQAQAAAQSAEQAQADADAAKAAAQQALADSRAAQDAGDQAETDALGDQAAAQSALDASLDLADAAEEAVVQSGQTVADMETMSEDERAAALADLASAQSAMDAAQQAYDDILGAQGTADETLAEKEGDLVQADQDLADAEQALADAIQALTAAENELASLENNRPTVPVAQAQAQLGADEQALAAAVTNHDQAVADRQRIEDELAQVEAQIPTAQGRVTQAEEAVTDAGASLAEAQGRVDRFQGYIDGGVPLMSQDTIDNLNTAQAYLTELQAELGVLQQAEATAQATRDAAQAAHAQLVASGQPLQQAVQTETAERDAVQAELDEVEEQLALWDQENLDALCVEEGTGLSGPCPPPQVLQNDQQRLQRELAREQMDVNAAEAAFAEHFQEVVNAYQEVRRSSNEASAAEGATAAKQSEVDAAQAQVDAAQAIHDAEAQAFWDAVNTSLGQAQQDVQDRTPVLAGAQADLTLAESDLAGLETDQARLVQELGNAEGLELQRDQERTAAQAKRDASAQALLDAQQALADHDALIAAKEAEVAQLDADRIAARRARDDAFAAQQAAQQARDLAAAEAQAKSDAAAEALAALQAAQQAAEDAEEEADDRISEAERLLQEARDIHAENVAVAAAAAEEVARRRDELDTRTAAVEQAQAAQAQLAQAVTDAQTALDEATQLAAEAQTAVQQARDLVPQLEVQQQAKLEEATRLEAEAVRLSQLSTQQAERQQELATEAAALREQASVLAARVAELFRIADEKNAAAAALAQEAAAAQLVVADLQAQVDAAGAG